MKRKMLLMPLLFLLSGAMIPVVGCSNPTNSPDPVTDIQDQVFDILKQSYLKLPAAINAHNDYTVVAPTNKQLTFSGNSNLTQQFWGWQFYFSQKLFFQNKVVKPIDGYLPCNFYPSFPWPPQRNSYEHHVFSEFSFPSPNQTNQLTWSFSLGNSDYIPPYQDNAQLSNIAAGSNTIRSALNQYYIFVEDDFRQIQGGWPLPWGPPGAQSSHTTSLYWQSVIIPTSEYAGINMVNSIKRSENNAALTQTWPKNAPNSVIIAAIWKQIADPNHRISQYFNYLTIPANYPLFYNHVVLTIDRIDSITQRIYVKINVAGNQSGNEQDLYFKFMP